MHIGPVQPIEIVIGVYMRTRLQADDGAKALRILQREMQRDAPADGTAYHHGPREIQRVHMTINGFADIAYHFVIDDGGRLFEGRALNVRGAHTRGHNTGTVGVVLLGDFERGDPTPEQLAVLPMLLQSLRDTYGITHLAGHRDFLPAETVCPGQALEARLVDLAHATGLRFGIDGYRAPV